MGLLVFLIGIALLGLIAFGLGWALLGNMAGTLLVTFAWFGTEFDRFLTGLVIVGPALGAVCMLAAIWLSLRASGRCRTRREMLRGSAAALAIVLGLGGTAWAANAVRMELYKAKYNLSYTHVAFELRLPAGTRVPAEKGDIRMTLSTPVLDSPAIFGARWASEEWLRRDGDRPVIMGLAPLRAKTTDRRVVLQWPGEPEQSSASTFPPPRPSGGNGRSGRRSRRSRKTASPARAGRRTRPRSAIASIDRALKPASGSSGSRA
ncbi:MAG TPA: hypothetical protein VKB16_12760 [Beijerinckiaceae bacterium]|nr:hypothetical protein [Beijerinckiaceae bacterium]